MISSKIIITLALLTVSIIMIDAFEVKNCAPTSDGAALIENVYISSCPKSEGDYCPLVLGKNITMELDFKLTNSFKSAKVEIYGKLGLLKVPFPLSPDDVCSYGVHCPAKANDSEKLVISLPVNAAYPKISVEIFLYVIDEKKSTHICLSLPAKLVD